MRRFSKVNVVKGAGRGKRMGVPTINFDPSVLADLATGIYVCRVIFGEDKAYWGALHFGPRPVFDEEELTLEATLFDFEKERIVPEFLDLEIRDYIREVRNFESEQQLRQQIDKDIAFAKKKIERNN